MQIITCSPPESDHESVFFPPLLNANLPPPEGLRTWNGSDPGQRYAVYRNNVMLSLTEALADNFPTIRTQVGADFFAAMAACYIRTFLPESPVLAFYGNHMPDFISTFHPLKDFPWLSSLARMDMAFIRAWHAEDAVASSPPLQHNDAVHQRLELHPSLQVESSSWAIYSLWMRDHDGEEDKEREYINPDRAEHVMLYRLGLDVNILPIPALDARFVLALMAGRTLGQAMETCQEQDGHFDPTLVIQVLLHRELVLGFSCDSSGEN